MSQRRFDPYRHGRLSALAAMKTPIDPALVGIASYAGIVLRLKRQRDAATRETPGEPLEEYKTICEFMRLYSTLRFYQLALLLGTSGAIVTALINVPLARFPFADVLLRCMGLTVALALAVMEFRASSYWHRLRNRANVLCARLAFAPFPVGSRWSPLTTSGAGFLLHAAIVSAWLTTIVLGAMRS